MAKCGDADVVSDSDAKWKTLVITAEIFICDGIKIEARQRKQVNGVKRKMWVARVQRRGDS
jgi:hypothetical protein